MIHVAKDIARVRNPVLVVTACAWALLITLPRVAPALSHCTAAGADTMLPSASFKMWRAMNSPTSLAAGWALMLVAMMLPVLISPILHVRVRSFTHRRMRSILLFLSGYGAIWMAAGVLLLAVELAIRLIAPEPFLAASCVLLIALVWQFSPVKQRCLNRCHAHTELAAFGTAADLDALRFGITHGIWCAFSCWAWMLFPMLFPRGHLPIMASVTILVLSERMDHPARPCWQPRGLGRVTRILIAQALTRLHAHGLGSNLSAFET